MWKTKPGVISGNMEEMTDEHLDPFLREGTLEEPEFDEEHCETATRKIKKVDGIVTSSHFSQCWGSFFLANEKTKID